MLILLTFRVLLIVSVFALFNFFEILIATILSKASQNLELAVALVTPEV